MLRRLSSRLRARLDGRGAGVSFCRGWPKPQVVRELAVECDRPAAELKDVIDALGACLEALREEHPVAGLTCDVVVADMWVAYDVIQGDLGELQPGAADEVVGASLADTLGLKLDDLTVRWQEQGEQRQLACALPSAELNRLRTVLEGAGVRMGAVEGEFVHSFNARRDQVAGGRTIMAVARDAGTQFGLVIDGGVAAVRFEPGGRDADRLQSEGIALLRCAGLDADDTVRFVADVAPELEVPEAWTQTAPAAPTSRRPRRLDLDLSTSRSRASTVSRITLAVGVAALLAAGWHLLDRVDARERAMAEQSKVQAALSEAQDPRPQTPTPKEARAAKASAAVVRELTVPWPALIATFEAAAGSAVALLAIEPASHRNEVRFTGEAKSTAAMLDYLDTLRGETLREVTLVSHQVQAQTPGTPVRFQAKAQWTRSIRTANAAP